MEVTFITRQIRDPETRKVTEWVVDAYLHNGKKVQNWYRAKTLKKCRQHIADQSDW